MVTLVQPIADKPAIEEIKPKTVHGIQVEMAGVIVEQNGRGNIPPIHHLGYKGSWRFTRVHKYGNINYRPAAATGKKKQTRGKIRAGGELFLTPSKTTNGRLILSVKSILVVGCRVSISPVDCVLRR